MENEEINELRKKIGNFLHNYYLKFGENKYDALVKGMSKSLTDQYGDSFSYDNLRIMEAEFVTFYEENKTSSRK